jgi:hypothetical protein
MFSQFQYNIQPMLISIFLNSDQKWYEWYEAVTGSESLLGYC